MKDSTVMRESETLAGVDHMSSEDSFAPNEEELQEVLEIFRQARRGLTEDSVSAVMVLRREIELHQALLDLLLEGKIEAWVIDQNEKVLTSRNLLFRAWPPDEKPVQSESPDEAAS
jgi:hypothetical protein